MYFYRSFLPTSIHDPLGNINEPPNDGTTPRTNEPTNQPTAHLFAAGGFSLARIQGTVQLMERLAARTEVTASEFAAAMRLRAAAYGKAPHAPQGSLAAVAGGSFYLEDVNDRYHRSYARKA